MMMCNSDKYREELICGVYSECIYGIWHGEKLNKNKNFHLIKDDLKKKASVF